MVPATPHLASYEAKPDSARHPLILDGLAVTFYLVFKEPAVFSGDSARAAHPNPTSLALKTQPKSCF